MVDSSNRALGQVVRARRESIGLTQEELGRSAGYRSGAGVSISRLEGGLVRPGAERFAGLAEALGLTPAELEALALEWEAHTAAAGPTPSAEADGTPGAERSAAPPGQRELTARKDVVEREVAARTMLVTDLSEAFNTQHDRARDEFFMRFVEIAERVEGAPPPDPARLRDGGATDADAVAAYRLDAYANGVTQTLAVGAASDPPDPVGGSDAAYETFVAVAASGAATAGGPTPGLSGVAAANARLLAAGGLGVAKGTMVLAGILAAPTVMLAAGGFAYMVRRNLKQRQERAAQLDEAEAELAATRAGVTALEAALPRATATLAYIATHAGHALDRWDDQLGSAPTTWEALGPAGQQRYRDFVDIAAAHVAIVTFGFQDLLLTRDGEQDALIQLADQVLTHSEDAVRALV